MDHSYLNKTFSKARISTIIEFYVSILITPGMCPERTNMVTYWSDGILGKSFILIKYYLHSNKTWRRNVSSKDKKF